MSVAFSAMRRLSRRDRRRPAPASLSISLQQRPRIDDDAVADDAELARAHDARRQQRQLVGLVADDERVAGVVAALEAHDDIGALRQPVDDLALALVAPLGADHRDVRHSNAPLATRPRRAARAIFAGPYSANSRAANPIHSRSGWPAVLERPENGPQW